MAETITLTAAVGIYLPGQTRPIAAGQDFTVPAGLGAELVANGSATIPPVDES
jgi:hypothetical protein